MHPISNQAFLTKVYKINEKRRVRVGDGPIYTALIVVGF